MAADVVQPVQWEIAALRQAVEDLAHRVNVDSSGREPDRPWHEPISGIVYGEWDVAPRRSEIRVRAGRPDGIPGLFLVDRAGYDMTALTIEDTYNLISALVGGLAFVRDDLTERRVKRGGTDSGS